MSTPADHGYIRCARCGTWRQPEHLTWEEHDTSRRWCEDVRWCSAMAEVGKGSMEADTGAPDAKRLPDDAWSGSNSP